MKVQFTPALLTFKNNNQQYKTNQNNNIQQNYSYNPLSYKDYNISFGARLFRSPENFYEQDFNKNNMPKSLHRYIYNPNQHDFRKTIPPAQAMKEVFGPIKYMQNLEQVRDSYPDEPLFDNLHSVSSRKARTGLLGELKLLREDKDFEGKSLFKNGDDDLGMYILKKIYIEGKTLKEINKDFQKDKSVVYKGLSDIQYVDLKAFGIRFPEQSFWKSFTATREEFPYVYIPRKSNGEAVSEGSYPRLTHSSTVSVKKHREPMSFEQRKRLSEFMINWHANLSPEEKEELRRKHKLGLEDSILHKYFGAITTISQDKVNLSDKMSEYFEKVYGNPDYLSYLEDNKEKKSQIMTRFWKSHDMLRKDYSKAMLETITEFDKAYGDDGANYDILRLVALARNIKENNEVGRQVRNSLRNEINQSLEKTDELQDKPQENITEDNKKNKEFDAFEDMLKQEVNKNDANIYEFELSDGTKISIVANLKEMMTQKIESELGLLPRTYVNKYIKFLMNHPKSTEKYMLSVFYNIENLEHEFKFVSSNSSLSKEKNEEINAIVANEIKSQLLSRELVEEISKEIQNDFNENNKKLVNTVNQVLMELAATLPSPDQGYIRAMIEKNYQRMVDEGVIPEDVSVADRSVVFSKIYEDVMDNIHSIKSRRMAFMDTVGLEKGLYLMGLNNLSTEQNKFVAERMERYRRPLSEAEYNKLNNKLVNSFINFDVKESIVIDKQLSSIYKASVEAVKRYPQVREFFVQSIYKYLKKADNSTYRYFLDPKADKKLLDAKTEFVVADFLKDNIELFKIMSSIDEDIMDEYIKPYDFELYMMLQQYRKSAAITFKYKL